VGGLENAEVQSEDFFRKRADTGRPSQVRVTAQARADEIVGLLIFES
jgi:hypothetical protein